MTKLTEDILRAQTCPFEMKSAFSPYQITVKYIGNEKLFYETSKNEAIANLKYIIDNYKLPEPEPKLVTMYECLDYYGNICFMDENFRYASLYCDCGWSETDEHAVRKKNGETMQLDISSDPWKWVVE